MRLRSKGFKVEVQPVIGHRNQRADMRIDRLLIECDSEHHSGAARRRDIRRDRKTLAKGWLTARIDYTEIIDSWDEVFDDIVEQHQRQVWRIHPGSSSLPGLID